MKNAESRIRENDLEITFLRQAILAARINASLTGHVERPYLHHSHECLDCNRTWTCDCDESRHLIENHGCIESMERKAMLARLANRSDDKRTSVGKIVKRKASDFAAQRIAANNAEIFRLRKELGL